MVAAVRRDYVAARSHHARSAELKEQLGLEPLVEKLNLGSVAHAAGDLAAAARLFEEVLAIHRRSDTLEGVGLAQLNLGLTRYRLGEHSAAAECFGEALKSFERLGFVAHIAHARQGLAGCAAADGRHLDAALLLGRAALSLAELGWSDDDFDATLASEVEATVRAAIGDRAFEEAYAGEPAHAPSR
jgi:tetratricopeptide (TPR) repeat protein